MKEYSFSLDQYQIDEFFKPIRSKRDIIILLMKSIKLMLIGEVTIPVQQPDGHMYLVVSKMSRLFYIKNNKFFTIGFPFQVDHKNNILQFSSKDIVDINNKITSDVLAFFSKKNIFEDDNTLLEELFELLDQPKLCKFLISLFIYEDGYIRYDHDPIRANEKFHPLHHYDLFYSNATTFKLGLKKSLDKDKMIDCLSIETKCHYIE